MIPGNIWTTVRARAELSVRKTRVSQTLLRALPAVLPACLSGVCLASTVGEVEGNNTRATATVISNGAFTTPAPLTAFGNFPTATLTGSIGIGTDVDFFRFSGTAGRTFYADVDNSVFTFDPILSLFSSNGTLLAYNDDSHPADAGSADPLDAFLGSFVLPTTGNYYLAVSSYSNFPTARSSGTLTNLLRPDGNFGGVQVNGATTGDDTFENDSGGTGSYVIHLTRDAGTDRNWINPLGGSWDTTSNWTPSVVPTSAENAVFNLDNIYTVTFPTNASASNVIVNNGSVTFNLGAQQLSAPALNVGSISGQAPQLFMGSGSFNLAGPAFIGVVFGSAGTFVISGGSFTTGDHLYVGYAGDGNMVQSGGTVTLQSGSNLRVGVELTGSGTYSLSAGTLNVTGSEYIGEAGAGTFNQTGGMHTIASTLKVGESSRVNLAGGTLKTAILDLQGTASRLNWTGGTLELTGSSVNIGNLNAASNTFGANSYTVGSGMTLTVSGNLQRILVGDETAAGTLNITGGGKVAATGNGEVLVGNYNSGTLNVSGANSQLDAARLYVGANLAAAAGTVSISSSGRINTGFVRLGWDPLTIGMLTVNNGTVANTGRLDLSLSGTSTLLISNGGSVSNGDVLMAVNASGIATATVGGVGSTWNNANIYVGGNDAASGGAATVTINSGGAVNVTGTTKVWNNNSKVNLTSGTLKTAAFDLQGTSSRLNWTGGVLELTGGTSNVGALNIPAAGVLAGGGTILGTVTNSGDIAPGASPGLLSITGNLNQLASGELYMQIAGELPAQFDRLAVSGNISLAGMIKVSLDGYVPNWDDTFDLLDWTGGFTNSGYLFDFSNAPLPFNFTWNTSSFSTTGIISVVPEPTTLAWVAISAVSLASRRRNIRRS